MYFSPCSLEEELETAAVLNNFDGEAGLESLDQQDRELEVSDQVLEVFDGGGALGGGDIEGYVHMEDKKESVKEEKDGKEDGGGDNAEKKVQIPAMVGAMDNKFGSLPVRSRSKSRSAINRNPLRYSFVEVRVFILF